MVTTDKQYKRQNREVSPETRQKISQSLKGRSKSYSHRTHIAQGVKTWTIAGLRLLRILCCKNNGSVENPWSHFCFTLVL